MSKQKSPTWSQIKARLSSLDDKELLNIVRDLYRLNADNKVFLATRLGIDDHQSLVEPYRRAIRREFNPDRGFPRLDIAAARKALNDFKRASADSRAVADLMVFYVEQGVACTVQYGDIDARFYDSLESVFSEVVALISETGDPEMIDEFGPRLEQIVYDTAGIGWGFHDYLYEVFYDEYPSEQ